VQAPLSEPSMVSWVSLFAPGPGTAIKDMDVVGDHCVLTVSVSENSWNSYFFILMLLLFCSYLPPWACAIETKKPGLAEFKCPLITPFWQLPTRDRSAQQYTLMMTFAKQDHCRDHLTLSIIYPSQSIVSACPLQDGTLVPVTLFHAVPEEGLRQAPLLAHVYGAYGRDLHMEFCPDKRLLLEQGWALAYCHIRGGGERGLSWQRQAREEGKQKGVEDLQACLQHLFSLGFSSPSLTALTAHSAGAVPVGALCNKHPHMMRAVTLQAPFLDVLGTMEDPSLPLTLEDREEWGDPIGNPKHRLTITSYCPLCNITPQRYPSMLLTAYSSDARVPLAGVLKYTEQLKKAIHTYLTTNPKSGMYTHTHTFTFTLSLSLSFTLTYYQSLVHHVDLSRSRPHL
uniref:Prolyl endopeptidase n=1 Tax=Lates calcarifer TaxID=8187 RepID=A0A4W6DR40_LATCA